MLSAMMKRKNLPIGSLASSSTHHAIDRGDRRCGEAEGDHHANQDFIALEFGRRHSVATAPTPASFRNRILPQEPTPHHKRRIQLPA
jgi:hypothetical protein